ncbi:MAG TPA: hypothetical protein VLV48_06865 [Thermoanaerobaculia bacterium]|nr:hypothetical protein [Thermoanaerobaculia bacterium]
MTLLLTIALLLGGVAPESATGWMEPARLGLAVGMSRATAEKELERRGHTLLPGKEPGHVIVHLSDKRTVTLAFEAATLRSIRFELVGFIPEIRRAFAEAKATLAKTQGDPSRELGNPRVLQYDATSPKIYVFEAADPATSFGKQGLGFLVIRYFEPPPDR